MRRKTCQVCGRKEGTTKDRCGQEDGIPLGRLEKCDLCGKWACPDCLHEMDCCFDDEDPDNPPPGWRVASRTGRRGEIVVYERIDS